MLASPLILIGGGLAIATDALVIHPISVLDDAQRDTMAYCWRSFGQPGHFVTDSASLPVRLIATPFIYLIDWGGRCIADVEPSPHPTSGEDFYQFSSGPERDP